MQAKSLQNKIILILSKEKLCGSYR